MVFSCNRKQGGKNSLTCYKEFWSYGVNDYFLLSSFNESFTYKKYNPVIDKKTHQSFTIFLHDAILNLNLKLQLWGTEMFFFFLLAGPTAPTATAIAATPTTGAPVRAADTAENVPWRMETIPEVFQCYFQKKPCSDRVPSEGCSLN